MHYHADDEDKFTINHVPAPSWPSPEPAPSNDGSNDDGDNKE